MKKILALFFCGMMIIPLIFGGAAFAEESDSVKIVGNYSDGDYIITDITVKDYGAVGDGVADDTAAFTQALQAASARGGAVVYVPKGKYILKSPIVIPERVTLCGEWEAPGASFNDQTVLVCDYESNGTTKSNKYFITLRVASCVRDLNVYYSKQSAKSPVEYPYTIGTDNALTTAMNITLLNSYNGINTTTAGHVENLYATAFNVGFNNRANYEISNFVNLNFSGKYLNSYDKTPVSDIKAGTENCRAVVSGKTDDMFIYGVNIDDEYYKNAIYLDMESTIPAPPKQAYGHIFRINGAEVIVSDPDYYMKAVVEDEIQNATEYSHRVASPRYSTKAVVYNVKDYGAKGNAVDDDTAAIRQALQAADGNGGGIVYLPAGKYKITGKLDVGENTEIRGAWDSPMFGSGTELHFYTDLGEDDAMITLSSGSGVRGVTVRIPDYGYDALETTKYPWIIRGNGSGVWAQYITFVNTWNGIDFASNKCDDFLIKGIWGTCTNQAIAIGGGSENGIVEYTMTTFGTWWEDTARATDKISIFCYKNAVGLTLGDVKNVAMFSASTFGIRTSLTLNEENGKGPENIRIIRLVSDLPEGCNNVIVNKGNNIAIVGLSTGGGIAGSKFVKIFPTFDGKMRVYGQVIWGNSQGTVIYSQYDYKAYNASSDEVDIIKFDFPWERQGSASVWIWIAVGAAVVVAAAVAVIIVSKNKKAKEQNKE